MENQNTEYKTLWKDEYLHYISGFANAGGGTLYIGFSDNGTLVGINNAKELLEKLPNKAVQATGLIPQINIHNIDGKDYLTISIKPSAQPISCNGKYYLRSGSTLQELNGAALQHFLTDKLGGEWDNVICDQADINDIDPDAVKYFVRRAIESGNMPKEAIDDSINTILHNLGLTDKQEKLKNAAVLLFGKNPQYFFITAKFRIGRFGEDGTDLGYQDEFEGNIIQMADKVMWTLRTKYLIAPIHYEGVQRIEKLEIPEDALRELVYNAIVHRDYIGTYIQMKVYNDRILLWNAGELPYNFDAQKAATEHISSPRNHLIAAVFYKAGFIESWGRGIGKVCNAFINEKLPIPTFENFMGGTLVTIPRSMFTSQDGGVNGGVNGGINKIELTDRQRNIVRKLGQNGGLTNHELAVIIGVGKRTIEREISLLKQLNIIQRIGSDKNGYWKVVYLL